MEFTLSVNDGLSEFLRLFYYPCRVFLSHLGQSHHEFLHLLFVDSLDGARVFCVRIFDEVVSPVAVLAVEGITSLHVLELHGTADITGA